jgi:ATP-dependent Lon protease
MEVIRLSGYVLQEKVQIAKVRNEGRHAKSVGFSVTDCFATLHHTGPQQYLIPSARRQTGTEESATTVSDAAINSLVRNYCRENGVRNLQKHIEKIHRKLALKMVKSEDPGRALEPGDLYDYVGKPVFPSTRMYETTPPGVAVGLAWTSMGMLGPSPGAEQGGAVRMGGLSECLACRRADAVH